MVKLKFGIGIEKAGFIQVSARDYMGFNGTFGHHLKFPIDFGTGVEQRLLRPYSFPPRTSTALSSQKYPNT